MNVILNVQGQKFETTRETIIKIPYFRDMFEACTEVTEIIFVNRPSNAFKHVLGVITDPLYPFPEKFNFELDFYGIEYTKPKEKLPTFIYDCIKSSNEGAKISVFNHRMCDAEKRYCVSINCLKKPVDDTQYCEKHIGIGMYCVRYKCKNARMDGMQICQTHK